MGKRDSVEDRSGSLLKNQAYEILRERIVSGEVKPGHRLSERGLGTELQMSKTPIKAALERLEEQGFVTLSPQRSAIVRAMSDKEISNHYELRMAVESFVAAKIAGRLDATKMAEVADNLRLQRKITGGTRLLDGWAEADYAFHHALAEAAENDEILKVLQLQRDRLFRLVRSIARLDVDAPARSCGEHHVIFEHIAAGRSQEAAAAVVEHLEHGRRFVLFGGKYGDAAE